MLHIRKNSANSVSCNGFASVAFVALFFLLLNISFVFGAPAPPLSLDKASYAVADTVTIAINLDSADFGSYQLLIYSFSHNFSYRGEFNPEMFFYPEEEGIYTVALVEKSSGATYFSVSFNVSANVDGSSQASSVPAVGSSASGEMLSTLGQASVTADKQEYAPGEQVLVSVDLSDQDIPGGVALYLEADGSAKRYAGDLNYINFIPQGVGEQRLVLKDSMDRVLGDYYFVINDSLVKDLLELRDKSGVVRMVSGVRRNAESGRVDLEFDGVRSGLNVRLYGVRNGSNPVFREDRVDSERVKINEKKVLKAFSLDAGNVDFFDGTATSVAVGRELWKCRQWVFETQECLGQWAKVMNLVPGMEYEIIITQDDPGYAETGVASINTKKPIYHPGESAELIVVVLDAEGHLVSGAEVNITITSPIDMESFLSTSSGAVVESERGVYAAVFSSTSVEGNYSLSVSSSGPGVLSSMFSNFEVRSSYEFDIIRDTPVTIDPWKSPLDSRIKIVQLNSQGSFDFTEVLPSDFSVIDSGGAEEILNGTSRLLRWMGLSNNSVVRYVALPPLVTPNLFALGKSFINYLDGGLLKTFLEARFWYLAIDPQIWLFYENMEGWGCQRASGVAPAAGDDCTRPSFGDFNGCRVATGERFCTSLDGAENAAHNQYALVMTNQTRWNSTSGIYYWFNPKPYDDIIVNLSIYAYSLDANREFCRIWTVDSNSWATIYQCSNSVGGCEGGVANPVSTNYYNYSISLASLAGINLNETNISVWLGGNHSDNLDYCYFDKINITGIAYAPNVSNLSYPMNRTGVTDGWVSFNFTVRDGKDSVIPNCTLWGNFSGSWASNITVLNVSNNTITNISINLNEGWYTWNVICMDSANLTDWFDQSNFTMVVDWTGPVATLILPANDSTINAYVTGFMYNLTATATDAGIGNISDVFFFYRVNSTDDWHLACIETNSTPPFNCTWNITGLNYSQDYEIRVYANDSLGNIGMNDTHINISILAKPVNANDIVVDDDIFISSNFVDLTAGTTKDIYCNVTVFDPVSYTNITNVNATLFSVTSTYGAADANRTHYTNTSCTSFTGSGTTAIYQCYFTVWYYAINGSWNCTALARDSFTFSNHTSNFSVGTLYAVNVSTSLIDYGTMSPGEISANVSVNITNMGNVPINISVYGFGGDDNDTGAGAALICEANNITVSLEKYSINSTASYASKRNLSSAMTDIRVKILPDLLPSSVYYNTTRWQISIPVTPVVTGECNGSIVFVATTG